MEPSLRPAGPGTLVVRRESTVLDKLLTSCFTPAALSSVWNDDFCDWPTDRQTAPVIYKLSSLSSSSSLLLSPSSSSSSSHRIILDIVSDAAGKHGRWPEVGRHVRCLAPLKHHWREHWRTWNFVLLNMQTNLFLENPLKHHRREHWRTWRKLFLNII